ncbi:DUF1254 domain-containing protein [Curvibacter sp. APW13]|uniref:DUF1254 domain-containing protein n=1 Tax=Curvibacter sp. APW13 TaxID=3077236 RepID=UPI0028DF3DBD|nr:DUF1254 domain-containing protein [Curvibacter sp. APW13]MDT8991691.1 DUF1254 domain-containing protein [Curvibacter sp. APW13]
MKNFSDTQRLWFYRGLTLLATAILVHLAAVWAAPRLIMQVLMNGPMAKTMNMHNQAAYPPAVTAASRSVVMPSPDMLYSVCAFDVRNGPVRVTADPKLPSYWSIALYAANSDNFFVINDRQAAGKPVDLWLVSDASASTGSPQPPAGSTVVVSPSNSGFLLMRVLTGNYDAEKDTLEPARRTLQCSSVAKG